MSLLTRMDNRSIEQFANDIALDTAKQRVWAEAFQAFLIEKTNKPCEKIEYGVDNDGALIEGSLKNNNVDNIFIFSGSDRKVEIKTIPEYLDKFMTFKVSSLRACVKQNAYILVPKRYVFYTYSPAACAYLCRNFPHKIYEKFSPNDLAVRIYKNRIDDLIEEKRIVVKSWSPSSRIIIEQNWGLLSKERVR
jgi:hypothetical protein